MLPIATYRLQLRNGVDFAQAGDALGAIAALGVSHLYLSPIFAATEGSTHGYDVTDPGQIDPALGGRAGFARLAEQARAAGLGIVLDIVPNHTAFTLENPWLRDVLRHGQDSRFARHFDIDWAAGPLILPWLPRTFDALRAEGAVRVKAEAADGPVLVVGDLEVPICGSAEGGLDAVLARQPWQLTQWEAGSDRITHRRFFNITELIGMRVDDAAVFDDMHRLVLDLVASGAVQGLRVDHVDGLRAPGNYLRRLRAAVGPDVPIWVEKIRVGDEALPDWPVEGTTGYEHARDIARVLTDTEGAAALGDLWAEATGRARGFERALLVAKRDILRHDLAAEVHRLIARAGDALAEDIHHDPGPETLRQAVMALLEGMPVYRSYFGDEGPGADDGAVMEHVRAHLAEHLRPASTALRLVEVIEAAQTPAEAAFRDLFQQTSGAVLAKSSEDTALYRYLAFPAACEVGAEPEGGALSAEAFAERAAAMAPGAMVLTSTHDTKRSEDARMRLVATSHLSDAVTVLWDDLCRRPEVRGAREAGLRVEDLWALMHALLAAWEPKDAAPDLGARVAGYMQKALREAKEITTPAHPDPAAEAVVLDLAERLATAWQEDLPEAAAAVIARGALLSLAQVAIKLLARGVPDIYQGCEAASFRLTDPDNRAAVDPRVLADAQRAEGFAGQKYRLTQNLLALRSARIDDLRGPGETRVEWIFEGLVVRRITARGEISVTLCAGREPVLAVTAPAWVISRGA